MKIVIYTAVFGNKDELKMPSGYSNDRNIDYLCFTDNAEMKSDFYQIVLQKRKFKDICKNARFYKIKGFNGIEKYDVAIWHDANITIRHNKIQNLIHYLQNADFATFKHPERNCVYEEGLACIRYNKDYAIRIFMQMILFYLFHYPKQAGLFETGIFVTNVKKFKLKRIHNYWWKWVKHLSRRDQLSLNISALKTNATYRYLPGCGMKNSFSIFRNHQNQYYKDKSFYKFFNNRYLVMFSIYGIKQMLRFNRETVRS